MKKAVLALLLILTLCLPTFASCDRSSETSPQEESPTFPNYNFNWEDPPEISTLAPLDYAPIIEDEDEDKQPERTVRYAASSESDKFHYLSCHYVDRIRSYNIVYYYTASEARRDGKSPCSVCCP
jgi:hypothetical protein